MARTPLLSCIVEFYLPPALSAEAVGSVARGSLRPLLDALERRPEAPITAALDPGFARALLRHGQGGVLASLATAVERGQVELAGGTFSHALLPRLPADEIERQLRLGHEAMAEALGRSWRPQGFIPPALAYARRVAECAADRGMRWLVADELALGRMGQAPTSKVATLRGRPDILLFFRDRKLSAQLAAGSLPNAKALRSSLNEGLPRREGGYRVVVVPATAFSTGSAALGLFEEVLSSGRGPLLSHLTTLATAFPDREAVEPLPSSWRTTARELEAGIPFAPWSAPDNELHARLWRLVNLGLHAVAAADRGDPAWSRMRALLDESLQTAPFRFASARPWWDGTLVKASARRLAAALEAGGQLIPLPIREEVAEIVEQVRSTVEHWEASGQVERRRASAEVALGTIEAELAD